MVEAKRDENLENKLIKASFTCRACGHHRNVYALIVDPAFAKIIDFKTGTNYRQGTPYQIIITPPLTKKSDIIGHIADRHAQVFHPGMDVDVIDIRN